jgi:putative ABC transport system ATP-binding protein
VIEFVALGKSYPGPAGGAVRVFSGLDIKVPAHSSAAILGRSGSGKSTLLAILGLIETPNEGKYLLDGQDTAGLSDREAAYLRGSVLGFVYQRFFLLRHLSAYANVETALRHGEPVPRRLRHKLVMDGLDQVGLADRHDHRPHQLSGGEQQRVAIARALVRSPKLVLADEPTGALDEDTANTIISLLLDAARERGATTVLVTHDGEVAKRTDRIWRLAKGSA